jgi:hypothetical protein
MATLAKLSHPIFGGYIFVSWFLRLRPPPWLVQRHEHRNRDKEVGEAVVGPMT